MTPDEAMQRLVVHADAFLDMLRPYRGVNDALLAEVPIEP